MINKCAFLVVLTAAASSFSQEIVSIEEVKPHTRVLVKESSGMVFITQMEDLIKPGAMTGPESLQFLSNPRLLERATLSPEQKSQIEKLKTQYQKESKELVAKIQEKIKSIDGREEKLKVAKDFFERLGAIKQQAAEKIESELIPFQSTIIKKYKFKQMSYQGIHKILLLDPFAKDLKLTEKQSEAIKKLSDETDKEIADALQKIRAKAKSKAMKILDKKQRNYIEQLSEDPSTE